MAEALTGLLAMMLLAFVRIPIALAMGIVGIVGYAYMRDWSWGAALATAQTKIYETGRNYTLSVVPLFILMGNFVTRAGMSQELFRTAYAFIGHLRGGLAMATIVGCAGFGAICGSSIATAATFSPCSAPAAAGPCQCDTPSANSTSAIADGKVKPAQAASAPRHPARCNPSAKPTWLLAGPGSSWHSATRSAKCASSSQRRRCTNSARK